ncbi:MAG TPA: fatty acid--CoA ligase family protein [Thermoanaerobaculia bacterium]|nr:fatty acid--CoA ligase family protein [Thermoanaerobaculia bacterium]
MTPDPILRSFEALTARDPLAILVASPERHATLADLDALARAAGSVLRGLPLPQGAIVGLAAANGPGFLASLLALRRAGCATLLLDAQAPESESLRIVTALGAAGLFRCRAGWPRGPEAWELTATAAPEPLSTETAVVKLTSGSTGAPRGIATPAEALIADDAALASTMGLRDDDRLLATIPMSHSYGLSSLVMPALMRGTLLIVPEEGQLFDPLSAAARTGATVFPTVPAVLDALLRLAEPPPWPESVRLVLTAGAPLSPVTATRFRESFGLPVHVFYGASECGGICYDREGTAGERGTVGTPVDGVRIVLEPEGEAGKLVVHSAAVAAGYIPKGDDRLGGGRFVAGDLAAWKDGELVLRGRVDDLVNIKGKKVNPREVESVVAQLPGVREVAVLGVPLADRSGEFLRAVVACPPGGLAAADVVAWCRTRLAPHKVPRSVVLVPELPRTSRGKLDRAQLVAIAGAEA